MWAWIGIGAFMALLLAYGVLSDWRVRLRGGRSRAGADIAGDRKAVRRLGAPGHGPIDSYPVTGLIGSISTGLMHEPDPSADDVTDPGNLGS